MGNSLKINSINFEDMQYTIKKNKIIINTLSKDNQNCLIKNTLSVNNEVEVINKLISESDLDEIIIIYGENSSDNKIYEKYKQLIGLGFTNIYVYIGGLFEWLLLQDIYGDDLFPTTKNINDHLQYKGTKIFDIKLLKN
ncbi:MAG: hypothetical protein CMD14_03970 [Flavobacteriales bacterium]|nr:hypothetical protein [Flavobacteriales bacterium]|tara:strand:- start:1856 stop:2272 length:417 start_codon:yes stop_codon:yes gene_type:complete